jgi:hypothetical protein
MNKANFKTDAGPSAASLREMPEVDFTKVRVRRNPYAAVIAREGIAVAHDEPSSRSLEDAPEVDFRRVKARANPYAEELSRLKAGRGRPKKGQEIGPTPARSIRLPVTLWAALEAAARDSNTTVHALLRLAVTHLLESNRFEGPAARSAGRRRDRRDGKARSTPATRATPTRPAGRARRRS